MTKMISITAGAIVALAVFAVSLTLLFSVPAIAQDNTVTIPWGTWLVQILTATKSAVVELLVVVLMFAVSAVLAMLPAWVRDIVQPIVNTMRFDQLVRNAALSAIGATQGAAAGREATIEVTNELVRAGMRYIFENGSQKVLDFAGSGINQLAEKLLARLVDQGVVPPDYTGDQAVEAVRDAL